MTDNFKPVREMIEMMGGLPDVNVSNTLDDFYTIEILRRGKDCPDLPAANYHFKTYHIYSWHDYEKYEQEIKTICDALRMRAYISVCRKKMTKVVPWVIAKMAERVANSDYKGVYGIFDSVASKSKLKGSNTWVIDVDDDTLKDDEHAVDDTINVIRGCESKYGNPIIKVLLTKSGVHIISRPFNLKTFDDAWEIKYPNIRKPEIKKNHLTLLYENVK